MALIEESLGRLYESIEALDTAAQAQAQRIMEAKQQDLFAPPPVVSDQDNLDPAMVARQLDTAIRQIETILANGTEG